MKKYIFGSALVATLALTSCEDFLDVQPEGDTMSTTYFTNDQRAIDAIDPIYYDLSNGDRMFGRDLYYQQAGACDIVWGRTRSFNTVATFKYTGNEGDPLKRPFEDHYKNIAVSNFIIMKLTAKQMKGGLSPIETRTLGEAHFFRGFLHLYIAAHYGTNELGVPFVQWEAGLPEKEYDNSIPKQQESVEKNYEYIVYDFEMAEKFLPKFEEYSVSDRGRAHAAAALGYKTKALAYWATWNPAKWNEVIPCVDRLESEYGRGLANTYDEVFSSDFANFWNREYLFSIPSTGGANGGGTELPGVMLRNKGWGWYNGWGYFKPTEDIYQEFAKDGIPEWDWTDYNVESDNPTLGVWKCNTRMRRSLLSFGDPFLFMGNHWGYSGESDLPSGFMIHKFMDAFKYPDATTRGFVNTNGNYPTVRINFPLMRMAEMYLFRAEANLNLNRPAEAAKDLNKLRVRSEIAPLQGNATFADLYHERRCELAFEVTDHLFDLKRWHKAGNPEIKALASLELNKRPQVRKYDNPNDANSTYSVIEYPDYSDKAAYTDDYMTFPYPSQQVINSGGALKQLPCWAK